MMEHMVHPEWSMAKKVAIALAMAVTFTLGFIGTTHVCIVRAEAGYSFLHPKIAWDDAFPFMPSFVWCYLLYYPLCFTPILLIKGTESFQRIAAAYSMEFFTCFVLFYSFPAQMLRPEVTGQDLSSRVLRLIFDVDPGFNILPSLHVANVVLIAILFFHYRKYRLGIIVALAALLVSLSTVLVKQHYIVDVFGGIVLAVCSFVLCFQWGLLRSFVRGQKTVILKESQGGESP